MAGDTEVPHFRNHENTKEDYIWEPDKAKFDPIPQLLNGKEYRTSDGNWDVLMRPVLASKQECLNCHVNAKPGATLGVMVYAVSKVINGNGKGGKP